jgi:hypothetical protein
VSPQIEAALIAGVVSLISLGGTVVVAVIGFRTTRSVTFSTLAEEHLRTLNERFATAAEKLGEDKPAAVRLAGVYAMAGLADDWEDNRQACIDVLCAYLRLPYPREPGPGQKAQLAFQADREVRHTVIRVIAAHLRDSVKASWQGRNFDFTGGVFDAGDFRGAKFSGGQVSFVWAEFSGGMVNFREAEFSGSGVGFDAAKFSGSTLGFDRAEFSGGRVGFGNALFSKGTVSFGDARFSGGAVFFGGTVPGAKFSGGTLDFSRVGDWSFPPEFPWTDATPPGVKLPKKEGPSQA